MRVRSRALGRPEAMISEARAWDELAPGGLGRFPRRSWRSREDPGGAGGTREAQGPPRSSPGTSRSSSEMMAAAFQKIGKLSVRVRLVSPEGGKIAQIGSLARWNRVDSRPSEGGGLFDYLGCLGDPAGSVRLSEMWRLVAILFLAQNASAGREVN